MGSQIAQPPIGEQPEQPSNGHEQLPNDPAQSSAGQTHGQQPGNGQPQPPYSPPPYGTGGYERPPAKRGKGFAIVGIILAVFVTILALIFSVIGLNKSKTAADAGKALSIAVSPPPVGAAARTAPPTAASSTKPLSPSPWPGPAPRGRTGSTADPGCITAASAGTQMTNTLNADKAAISRDQNNPSAERADLQHLVTDLQSLQRQMATAEAQATHKSVKTGISAMTGDLNTFSSGLQAVENGDLSQVNQITTAGDNLKSDDQALKTTCTSVSPPGPNR